MLIAELAWNVKWADMNDEQKEVFVNNWPTVKGMYENRKKAWPEDPTKWEVDMYGNRRQRIGIDEALALQSVGIDFDIEGVDGTMLTRMQDRVSEANKYGEKMPLELNTGQVVQIAVPDLGLLQITEVTWMEDACTEALQEMLNDGWRILAVCPPNAQRRPDYILGRRKRDT